MKAFLCVLALAIPATVFGDDGSKPPLVTTSGTAEIRVVPDLADLYFDVEVRNPNLDEARKQQSERVAKVLAVLRAAGIKETELEAEQVRIGTNHIENRQETSSVKFYFATQRITCTLHDLSKVTDLTAEVITAGATDSHGVTLRTSTHRKYRDEARIKAIRAAKEKAVALATELGAKVGKPYSITEGRDSFSSHANIVSDDSQDVYEAMSTFAPGTIGIRATIEVSFVLE